MLFLVKQINDANNHCEVDSFRSHSISEPPSFLWHGGCTVSRATVSPSKYAVEADSPQSSRKQRPLSYRVFKSNVMDVEINTVFCGWTYSHQRFLLLRPPLREWESSCGSVVARKEVELLTKCWARLNSLKLTWIEISHINWYSSFYRVIGMGLSSNQLINW